jgi:hypothetical protein
MPEKGVSEVEETFEFIQTPPAKEPAPSSTECGVRTTAVRKKKLNFSISGQLSVRKETDIFSSIPP